MENIYILKSKNANSYDKFNSVFQKVMVDLDEIKLSAKQKNKVFEILSDILVNYNELRVQTLREDYEIVCGNLDSPLNFVKSKIETYNTSYKRNKDLSENPSYVEPVDYGIGTRWEPVLDKETGKRTLCRIQSTFQYVSICKTLESMFAKKRFLDVFNNFNNNVSHTCAPGIYTDFCCGDVYKNQNFSKDIIQLQLFTDEFEVCSPLKSKSGIHKICAFYLQIRNLPGEYSSRLKNIYLVALCNANDVKSEFTNIDNILRLIVKEIRSLETKGIELPDGSFMKARLMCTSFDNLGGNGCFGFAEGFNAKYFCKYVIILLIDFIC